MSGTMMTVADSLLPFFIFLFFCYRQDGAQLRLIHSRIVNSTAFHSSDWLLLRKMKANLAHQSPLLGVPIQTHAILHRTECRQWNPDKELKRGWNIRAKRKEKKYNRDGMRDMVGSFSYLFKTRSMAFFSIFTTGVEIGQMLYHMHTLSVLNRRIDTHLFILKRNKSNLFIRDVRVDHWPSAK